MTLVMLSLMTCGMYYDGGPGLILDPLTSFGPLGFDARDVSLVKGIGYSKPGFWVLELVLRNGVEG